MKRCKTCKWWHPPDNSMPDPVSFLFIGDDDQEDNTYGLCLKLTMKQDGKNDAVPVDGSDYYAAVRCRGTFGCILWEQA